jgi:peptide/nickel transport system substrate-binding protein
MLYKKVIRLRNVIMVSIIVMMLIGLTAFINAQGIPREETLIFARGITAIRFNDYAGTFVPQSIVYLTLFLEGESYGIRGFIPLLAKGYEWIDPFTVRIYIRPEATWSDGKPITADDVIYTIKLGIYLGRGPGSGCSSTVVEEIRKVDDKTIELKMNKTSYEIGTVGYIRFISCWITLRVYPKHIFEQINATGELASWKNTDPAKMVVSGPYRVFYVDEANRYIYFIRDDYWWGKSIFGLPRPKYLILWLAEDSPRVTSIRAAQTDWDGSGGLQDIWNYFKEGIHTWDDTKPPYYRLGSGNIIAFNMKSKVIGILGDQYDVVRRAIRLAMVYAFPWDEHIEKALQGVGEKGTMAWLPNEPSFDKYINRTLCKLVWGNEDCTLTTDLDKARAILDEAGVIDRNGDGIRELPDGTPLKITYIVRASAVREIIAQLYINNLKKLGFSVDYKVISSLATIQSLIQSGSGWDIVDPIETITINWASPYSTYRPRLHSGSIPSSNYAWYNNSEMDKWLDLLSSPFEEERIYAASRVQELLYRDIPYIVYSRSGGGAWYQYRIDYWIGWPNASNPWWWPAASFSDSNFPIPFGLASKVKGEKPTVPWWVKPTDQGGLMVSLDTLWKQIAEILKPRPIVITITTPTTTPTPTPTPSPTTPRPSPTPTPTTPRPTPTPTPTPTTPVTGVATITVVVTQSVEKTIVSTSTILSTTISTILSTTSTTVREIDWTTTIAIAVILLIIGLTIGIFIKRK